MLEMSGFVFSCNNDPYKLTEFHCKAGDTLTWKRNGQRGSVKARIVGWDSTRPGFVQVQNLDSEGKVNPRKVWIKIRSVLRVLPNSNNP